MWDIILPTSIQVSAKTKFYLNLNQYRNAHFHTLNKAKVLFKDQVTPILKDVPHCQAVELIYTLFVGSETLLDTSNVCSIVDKFFCDTLSANGIIDDDNYLFVKAVDYRFGGKSKGNPHVVATIKPVGVTTPRSTQEEEPMQITIAQAEIEEAIRNHIKSLITVQDGNTIDIDLKATRGAEGFQAIIDISPAGTAKATPAPAAVAETPAKAEAKPLKIEEAVAEAKEVAPAPEAQTIEADVPATEKKLSASEQIEADAAPTPEEAPRPSLFGGLTKPTND